MVWVLETRPFFAPLVITGANTYPPIQLHPVCATALTDPTAVSASDVAGDTPWTSLGPFFRGNLFVVAISHPPPPTRAERSVKHFWSPAERVFVLLMQTMVATVPSYHLFVRAQLSGQPKQSRALILEENLLSTFSYSTIAESTVLLGRCSIQPPYNYNTG